MTDQLLTITAVGYSYTHEWHVFINSLLLQTDDRWFCQLMNDGPDPVAREIVSPYVESHPEHFSFVETDIRFNDWGHSLRALGLGETKTKYWATQNADNYLMPRYVELVLKGLSDGSPLVVFPCVHSYPNVGLRVCPAYSVLQTEPKRLHCDAGTMVLETELARHVGWNGRQNEADGQFIEEVMARRPQWSFVPNILMVHN